MALRPNADHGLLILDVSRSHTATHHSDKLVAETSTWKHTTLTTDKHQSHRGRGYLSVVSVVSCQVRGLCDELITRPEESYRLCCVVVCDLGTSRMGAPYIYIYIYIYIYDISRLRVKAQGFYGRLRVRLQLRGKEPKGKIFRIGYLSKSASRL